MTMRSLDVIEAQLDEASDACTRQSAQMTELRRQVLGLVLRSERPATAYQLLDRLKETRPGAVPPTVYRALDFLLEHKLVHKVERLNAFVACTGTEQHAHVAQFLICGVCGSVTELDSHLVEHALKSAAREAGFTPSNSTVEIEGTCAVCNAESRPVPSA